MTFGTTGLIGFGAGGVGLTLMDVLSSLGLTTNLKLCLDAGDAQSYPGSGQKWLDRSGNGTDFFLGSDNTASGSDPTFNGAAGAVSAGEYFSFDGGDYFTYDTTNEAWMNTLHKDSALFSVVAGVYVPGSPSGTVFGTNGVALSTSGHGVALAIGAKALFEVDDGNGGDAHELSIASSATLPTAAWSIIGLTIDETGGAGASRWFINGTHETFNGAYNTPSASAASHPMAIGSRGNGAALLSNGAQIAFAGFIQGTALGQTDFDNIFALMRGRYGI